MKFRTFRESDTAAVVALWARCSLTVPWNDPEKDIARKAAVQPELFIICEKDRRVIGSVMGGYDGHRGWIYYLAVDPEHRRKKIGTMLVNEVEQRVKAHGCPKINLMVRTGNRKITAFYRTLGYKTDEVVVLGKRIVPD